MSEKKSKTNGLPEFKGPFADLIVKYIDYKRAQGYRLHDPIVYRLREMDLFFLETGVQEIKITREMYDAWTAPKPAEKATTTQKRQNAIRGFADYLVLLGYKDVYTGYDDTRIFKRDFIPYVFSVDEIGRIFHVLSGLCRDNSVLRSHSNASFLLANPRFFLCFFLPCQSSTHICEVHVPFSVSLDTAILQSLPSLSDISFFGIKSFASICTWHFCLYRHIPSSR